MFSCEIALFSLSLFVMFEKYLTEKQKAGDVCL